MAFLKAEDYAVQIRSEVQAVINHTNGSQAIAEQMAEAEISSYLRPRGYDVTAVFAAEGTNRNATIIMLMIDITLYHLHSGIVNRAIPKTREDRYNAAISWLEKVSRGLLDPALPRLQGEDQDATPTIKLGSNPKYSKRY